MPTVKMFIHNGKSKIMCNSKPTTNAFTTTGIKLAIKRCFMYPIKIALKSVAKVPNIKSHGNIGELIFAKSVPTVTPKAKSLRKKHRRIKSSAILICIPKNETGSVAIVNIKYKAATKALTDKRSIIFEDKNFFGILIKS